MQRLPVLQLLRSLTSANAARITGAPPRKPAPHTTVPVRICQTTPSRLGSREVTDALLRCDRFRRWARSRLLGWLVLVMASGGETACYVRKHEDVPDRSRSRRDVSNPAKRVRNAIFRGNQPRASSIRFHHDIRPDAHHQEFREAIARRFIAPPPRRLGRRTRPGQPFTMRILLKTAALNRRHLRNAG
jgi:hypothetical protein